MTTQGGEEVASRAPETADGEANVDGGPKSSTVVYYGEHRQILFGPLPPPEGPDLVKLDAKRAGGTPTTPAMAAGVADRPMAYEEVVGLLDSN